MIATDASLLAVPSLFPPPRHTLPLSAALPLQRAEQASAVPGNRLWSALASLAPLLPASELVLLRSGARLMYADQCCPHVYFPCTTAVSLLLTTQQGKSCQVGMIGNDGVVGVQGLMGNRWMPYEAVVCSSGLARRVSVAALARECAPGTPGGELLLRDAQAQTAQMAYAAVCCQHHNVEQRTCRLLLQAFDAADGGELRLTHELMSECLGVRRESISMVAHRLHQERVISYTRGRIALVDRAALEARSCECYAVVKNDLTAMFDQGLGASGVRHPAQTRGRHAPRTHVAAC